MTINELIERAHSDAKAAGWWDEERNTGELLMLIVSECGEALEAHRGGKRAALMRFDQEIAPCMMRFDGDKIIERTSYLEIADVLKESFRDHIKDTFEDELADIVIRIADLCGNFDIIHLELPESPMPNDSNVGAWLLSVTGSVLRIESELAERAIGVELVTPWSSIAMSEVFGLAKKHNIDLWRHIELKLAYNKTRGKKHGKAY